MNKVKLNRVFKLVKEKANMDYAITNTDEYGDCNTCVNYGIADEFGVESTGIYAKHWLRGMNKGEPWKALVGVYIGHDITEEQGAILVKTFEENGYIVNPRKYDSCKSFWIAEE